MNGEFRLRIEFQKSGRGRWLSHLEVLHTIERIIRRANMPYAITQGFNPHMKLAMGPALSVGTGSDHEYLDLWLTEFINPGVALENLAAASPAILPVTCVKYVNEKLPSLTASLTITSYRATLAALDIEAEQLAKGFQRVRSRETLEVEQRGKTKVFDPSLCIPKDAVVTQQTDSCDIEFTLRISPSGTLRPDALIQAVIDESHATFSHVELVRTGLFIETDEGAWVRPL